MEMHRKQPKVSIGLPVYNGERFLQVAMDSVLSQTFTDFELIICDNASTDRTEEICRSYATNDHRIKYFRNNRNVGAAPNFNRTFELSGGTYFKWVAHDDIYAPEYLARCVEVLNNHPDVVLCHSKIKFIDEHGKVIRNHQEPLKRVHLKDTSRRFKDLINLNHWCLDIFGLTRSNSLKKTRLIDDFYGADRHLLVELGLQGKFHRIPDYLFFSREHSHRSVTHLRTIKARARWINARKGSIALYPHWNYLYEYFRSLSASGIAAADKIRCYVNLVKWVKHNWWHLTDDVIYARNPYSDHILKYKRK